MNTYTTGVQSDARAAMEPDGDFVVVWASVGQDGSGYGVFGQRFDAAGGAAGRRIPGQHLHHGHPGLRRGRDRDATGDFVVVWESYQDGSARRIQGQRFDAAGTAIGDEFLVNTYTTGTSTLASVAGPPTGDSS